jgi:hypothetical protein
MIDRPRRRGPAVPVLLLATLVLTLVACSKPVTGTPAAAPGAETREEEPTTTTDAETSAGTTASGDLAPLIGSWSGEYTCLQGETGLRMTIEAADETSVQVVFEFFPVPENPSAETGSFEMIGAFSGDQLQFKQQKWIDQPSGYQMVDLVVTSPVEPGMNVLSGDVEFEGCKGFSVRRE